MLHNVLVHVYLKSATIKIKTFTNTALKTAWLKWLSKFEMLEKALTNIKSPP